MPQKEHASKAEYVTQDQRQLPAASNESIDFMTPLVQPYDYHQPAAEHAYDVILKRRGGCEIFVRTYCGKTLNDVMAMLNKSDFDNVEILRIIDSETKDILWDKTVSEV